MMVYNDMERMCKEATETSARLAIHFSEN